MITQPANAVTFSELLGYAEIEWRRWREWFDRNPAALDVPIDVAGASRVRDLVKHIVLVDLRYAEWLLGEPLTPPDGLDALSSSALLAVGDRAYSMLHRVVETTADARWADVMPFPKPMEHVKPTRRKCFIHVVVHSTRHWAQLATALRAASHAQDWQHDLIFTTAID